MIYYNLIIYYSFNEISLTFMFASCFVCSVRQFFCWHETDEVEQIVYFLVLNHSQPAFAMLCILLDTELHSGCALSWVSAHKRLLVVKLESVVDIIAYVLNQLTILL